MDTTIAVPSVAQMVNRSLSGHRLVLAAIRDGQPLVTAAASPGQIRGLRTVIATLRRWDCIDSESLTDRGRDLLAALDAKANR